MAASDKVLVYHYRHGGSPAVQDGLAVITRQELGEILHGSECIPFQGETEDGN